MNHFLPTVQRICIGNSYSTGHRAFRAYQFYLRHGTPVHRLLVKQLTVDANRAPDQKFLPFDNAQTPSSDQVVKERAASPSETINASEAQRVEQPESAQKEDVTNNEWEPEVEINRQVVEQGTLSGAAVDDAGSSDTTSTIDHDTAEQNAASLTSGGETANVSRVEQRKLRKLKRKAEGKFKRRTLSAALAEAPNAPAEAQLSGTPAPFTRKNRRQRRQQEASVSASTAEGAAFDGVTGETSKKRGKARRGGDTPEQDTVSAPASSSPSGRAKLKSKRRSTSKAAEKSADEKVAKAPRKSKVRVTDKESKGKRTQPDATPSDPSSPSLSPPTTTKSKSEPWQVQKAALREKFAGAAWAPRKRVSPDTQAGMRALHAADPTTYTTAALATHFALTPEAVRRILRSKWTPSPTEQADRLRRWENRGRRSWEDMSRLGLKPPRKWRALGVPRPENKPGASLSPARRRSGGGGGEGNRRAARGDWVRQAKELLEGSTTPKWMNRGRDRGPRTVREEGGEKRRPSIGWDDRSVGHARRDSSDGSATQQGQHRQYKATDRSRRGGRASGGSADGEIRVRHLGPSNESFSERIL